MEGEMLTIEEIRERFAPDWVLIGEPDVDEYHCLLGGKVMFHSPVRDEVYRKATELRLEYCAFEYCGRAPEDMEFALNL